MSGFIYEVKMQVHSQVYDPFILWLKTHMREMLELGCFTQAELLEELEGDTPILRAHYYYSEAKDFQNYLDQYAEKMRGDLAQDIKNKIIFTRRHLKRF